MKTFSVLSLFLVMLAAVPSSSEAEASTYKVLYSFPSQVYPQGDLARDKAGNLYGTTALGGAFGLGTVFRVTPKGDETVVHSFKGQSDGAEPVTGLTSDGAGSFYGTTYYGGEDSTPGNGLSGFGIVFKVSPKGVYSVVKRLHGASRGASPVGPVVGDGSGNIYVAASAGNLCGYLLKVVSKNQPETILHQFSGHSGSKNNGCDPESGLTSDGAGNLYGTTWSGGKDGAGSVFTFNLASQSFQLLASFKRQPDLVFPNGVIPDQDGNIYGTAAEGGRYSCAPPRNTHCGFFYKIAPDGTETVLYNFQGGGSGSYPIGNLVRDAAGNFYGTTIEDPVLFKISPSGVETVLHTFSNADGTPPGSGLIMGPNGHLYGVTQGGGQNNGGVVYELTP